MKPEQYLHVSRSLTCLIITLCIVTACSRKLTFSKSAIVPAAQGYVKVKKDKNKNYAVNLDVRHLSPPDRLVEARNVYVVWADTKDNGIRNMGRLNSSRGLFSKKLKSDLQTVTIFEPKNFFITAEKEADISYPEGQVVMTTR
ncbi:hypothetical protein [Dyadobacter sandarakinus]|uniref:Gliding motility-associated lipoprotein GldH n=1 Tax=Dyadobacter sandarakinus TaxID=2747268 RepID=A0ABX7I773_9BACT|nr:hypothetical protein [Dyadobacter sandarakinus]QRR00831.1 hypothetical protein HWI92_07865 [Dyadobacter sandarakinus]